MNNVTRDASGALLLEPLNDANAIAEYKGIYHVMMQVRQPPEGTCGRGVCGALRTCVHTNYNNSHTSGEPAVDDGTQPAGCSAASSGVRKALCLLACLCAP